MQPVVITMNVDDEFADPAHPMGVTEQGFEAITGALAEFGTDIEVEAAPAGRNPR